MNGMNRFLTGSNAAVTRVSRTRTSRTKVLRSRKELGKLALKNIALALCVAVYVTEAATEVAVTRRHPGRDKRGRIINASAYFKPDADVFELQPCDTNYDPATDRRKVKRTLRWVRGVKTQPGFLQTLLDNVQARRADDDHNISKIDQDKRRPGTNVRTQFDYPTKDSAVSVFESEDPADWNDYCRTHVPISDDMFTSMGLDMDLLTVSELCYREIRWTPASTGKGDDYWHQDTARPSGPNTDVTLLLYINMDNDERSQATWISSGTNVAIRSRYRKPSEDGVVHGVIFNNLLLHRGPEKQRKDPTTDMCRDYIRVMFRYKQGKLGQRRNASLSEAEKRDLGFPLTAWIKYRKHYVTDSGNEGSYDDDKQLPARKIKRGPNKGTIEPLTDVSRALEKKCIICDFSDEAGPLNPMAPSNHVNYFGDEPSRAANAKRRRRIRAKNRDSKNSSSDAGIPYPRTRFLSEDLGSEPAPAPVVEAPDSPVTGVVEDPSPTGSLLQSLPNCLLQ